MVESSKNLKPLRQQVTNLLAQAAAAQNWTPPNKDTPVTITTNFYYKPGKTVTRKHHTTKPDGDKLQRFCWDAISDSKIWQDDSQATNWTGSKQYGPEDRIDIVISY
jgi:Holliday junction resolvase RusA-like endonuclease